MTKDREDNATAPSLRDENRTLSAQLQEREQQVATADRRNSKRRTRGSSRLYAELDDTAQALRGASELKSRFLSYMSHEFRTPLGAIRSLTRLLLDRMDGPLTRGTGEAGAASCRNRPSS